MGSNNVKALKDLKSTLEHPFIYIDKKKIFTMFDPPHLLKYTVALFRKYNVQLPVSINNVETLMEAKFNDVIKAHEIDKEAPTKFRSMFKLTSIHMAPVMRYAMKVSIAAQTLSRSVGAYLYSLVSRGDLEQRTIATATFACQVDELFDSLNGTRLNSSDDMKPLKCAVTEESNHVNYWKEAYHMVQKWSIQRFTKRGNVKQTKPPSQMGWLVSLRAVQCIWDYMKKKGAPHLRPRYLNQDALENLFGAIRAGCGSGDNPTTVQFTGSLKTQILNGLSGSGLSGTNCQADEHELLSNLQEFLNVENIQLQEKQITIIRPSPLQSEPQQLHPSNSAEDISDLGSDTVSFCTSGILSVAYVSGFLVKHILKTHKCDLCQQLLCSEPTADYNIFISYKEWSEDERKLIYPSEQLVQFVGKAVSVLEDFIPTFGNKVGIAKAAAEIMSSTIDHSWFSCADHKPFVISAVVKGICRIGLPWWAKRQNIERTERRKESRSTKNKLRILQHK